MDRLQTRTATPVRGAAHSAPAKGQASVTGFVSSKADKVLGSKQRATTLADVKKHDYKQLATDMSTMTGQARLDALSDLRNNHFEEYQGLLTDMRAGKVTDSSVKVGISLDRLKSTDWARSEDGAKVMKHLETQYQAGLIVVQDKSAVGGLGSTVNFIPQAGANGKTTGSIISLSSELANSPEGSAAILAHEGQHSQRASQGTMKRALAEETDANMVSAKVWSDFADDKYDAPGTPHGGSLDITSRYYNPGSSSDDSMMKSHVAAHYAQDYADKGEWAAAGGVLKDYLGENAAGKGALIKSMGDEDLRLLTAATAQVGPHTGDADWLGKQATWLQQQVDKRSK